ncbi:MAG: amidohydrolase [Chloroflexi bacterium]|nr:amidohydrolase [Chloroflexota bacterium]
MRIDAHVHYTPPEMAADLRAFAEQEPYWGLLVAGADARNSVQGWATAETMIADLDAAGIDRVVLMGEYRQQHAGCVGRNDESLAIMRRWPERVSAFAVVQPRAGRKALDELKRCLDAGMAGVGELGPYGQDCPLDDRGFAAVAEACIRYGVPLNLHVSEEIGHFYLGKSTTPLLHYYGLAQRYPELKLILAHWGGGLLFYEIMPEVRRTLKNVWYDTAGSPLLFPTEAIFRTALQCVDHRKLLYGSDYPLLIYPRKQRTPDFRPFLAEIAGLGLAPAVYDDIMGRNAARLLGLESSHAPGAAEPPGVSRVSHMPGTAEAPGMSPGASSGAAIGRLMAVSAVAQAWPETQRVFERYRIPWRDTPVPYWEPIVQAAAARGWGPKDQRRLLDDLNAAIEEGLP